MIVVYDDLYAKHLQGIPHPESPDRVEVIASFLRDRATFVAARDATGEEIERVHTPGYVDLVREEVGQLHGHAGYLSTGDTVVDAGSLTVARRAAGGAIVAAQTAMEQNAATFAIVRPPGHHAESTRGMGFCVFNNAAIAARAMQMRTGARTLVVDFDYHHGNGTQAVSGEGLSYVSTHGYPAYPGTGGPDENYALDGSDAIVNLPLPPHAFGTEAFIATWERLLPAVAARVRPDLLVVSAGFDYVSGDPVGDLGVDVSAAGHLARIIRDVGQLYCGGRTAYVLEGGYDTSVLAASVGSVVSASDAAQTTASGADAQAIPEPQQRLLDRIDWVLKQ